MDREKVKKELIELNAKAYGLWVRDQKNEFLAQIGNVTADAVALLKEQENLLGIQQTADSITFISTGTAQQGEERGIMLGKSWMHEWLKKELLHRELLTDEIRSVFDEAKRQ